LVGCLVAENTAYIRCHSFYTLRSAEFHKAAGLKPQGLTLDAFICVCALRIRPKGREQRSLCYKTRDDHAPYVKGPGPNIVAAEAVAHQFAQHLDPNIPEFGIAIPQGSGSH
jgi:hypothetical protein